jgi:hypothetical protein
MTTLKNLIIIALLVAGTSLAIAQNGPATGGQPPAGAAAGIPGAPGHSSGALFELFEREPGVGGDNDR